MTKEQYATQLDVAAWCVVVWYVTNGQSAWVTFIGLAVVVVRVAVSETVSQVWRSRRRPTDPIPGSVGERLALLAYRSSQIVNMATVVVEDEPRLIAKTIKAIPELVANLYFDLAAVAAALPTSVSAIKAPDALPEPEASEHARAAARVQLVLHAYADFRAQFDEQAK